jgi:hypothetical protein
LVTRLESSNTRQEKVVQETELNSMAANVEERRAEEDRARTFKFGGWVVSLQRLETDPYLGKKERVRLDVFRGRLCSHNDLTCNIFPPQDARCSMTRSIRSASA